MKVDPIVQTITKVRNELVLSALEGNYAQYKKARIENAKLTLENFEVAKKIQSPSVQVPLFSVLGFRLLKFAFLDFFRTKTPEEKQLKEIGRREYLTDRFIKNK